MEGNNRAARYKEVYLGRYWKIVLPLVLLLIFFWGVLSASLQQQQSPGLSTATISASGLLQGSVYNLMFQDLSGGIISEIDVTQGQSVRQGQVLARLNPVHLQRTVDAARAATLIAHERIDVTTARLAQAIKELQTSVFEAETDFNVAKLTLQKIKIQAQKNIEAAELNLASDKRVLASVQRQADAHILAAQATLRESIASCQSSSSSGASTPTSPSGETPTPTSVPSGTSTPTPVPSGTSTTSTSQSGSTTAQTQSDTACIRNAQAQYQQAVTEAQTSIVTEQAQVEHDQVAVAQAIVDAEVVVTAAQGLVAVTQAHVLAVKNGVGPLDAQKDVTEAKEAFIVASDALYTAELHLQVDTVLVAPHDGVVTAINGTVGGPPGIHVNLAPKGTGAADSSAFIQLVDPSHVDQILLNVDEADIMKVKVGQSVQFTLKAYANRQFSGTVGAISPNGVSLESTMAFPVIVRIAPESVKEVVLFPNMTATATINI